METISIDKINQEASISNTLDYLFSVLNQTEGLADNEVVGEACGRTN